ncbi:MAG: UDP-3-O-[3-hydroxymyristoyl] N-acetylglucosamine deacetylase [Gemmatimonadetes bacterium]|nr:UDP-3-O-[3-hydroxymyristoyl] N-acetylglucosamine deacetylase [Gemmatimonadota bacterium]
MIGLKHRTIGKPVTLAGVGVHSGEKSSVTFRPDPTGPGIRFRRTDLTGTPDIPADLDHVVGTDLGTNIAVGEDARVSTVEHVMAALSGAGVTRVIVEVDGPEPPILDGSFRGYLEALSGAGIRELEDPVPVLRIPSPITEEAGKGSHYVAIPSDSFRVSATIEFDHPAIGRQYGSFRFAGDEFASEIGPARTFGFEAEANVLRARGLARGASLENTIVLSGNGILNDDLRFPDEFLRHKVGDLVGDLALLGARLETHIVAERPSHAGNVALAHRIASAARRNPSGAPIVDIQKILEYLPHRFPMLLVDRVLEFEQGKRIVGVKNVTINEPFFQGHYPGHPIMPGVLIIEAMAQMGGLLLMDTIENPADKVVYFMSLDNVKWRRPVTPGDQLVLDLQLLQLRRNICRLKGEAYVDGRLVAEAELMATVKDR